MNFMNLGKCLESIQHIVKTQLNLVVLHFLCHVEHLFLSQSNISRPIYIFCLYSKKAIYVLNEYILFIF